MGGTGAGVRGKGVKKGSIATAGGGGEEGLNLLKLIRELSSGMN